MNNKAATEWTMAKLLTIVLGVILLVLIAYGISTNGFKPLQSKIANTYNEVLIMIGIRTAPLTTYDCKDRFLKDILGGKELAQKLKINLTQELAVFNLCKDLCVIKLKALGDYRIGTQDNKQIEQLQRYTEHYWIEPLENTDCLEEKTCGWISNSWQTYDEYLISTLQPEELTYLNDLYNSYMEQLTNKEKGYLEQYYKRQHTGRIILWTTGKKIAIWQNGEWTYGQEGNTKKLYQSNNTEKALTAFLALANNWINDDIYLKEEEATLPGRTYMSNPDDHGTPISELLGGNNEVDGGTKEEQFRTLINKKMQEQEQKTTYTTEEIQELTNTITTKEITLKTGGTFTLTIHQTPNTQENPIILLTNKTNPQEVYGLQPTINEETKIYPTWEAGKGAGINEKTSINLITSPLELVIIEGNKKTIIAQQQDYKLNREDFENFKQGRIIRDFLTNTCREGTLAGEKVTLKPWK